MTTFDLVSKFLSNQQDICHKVGKTTVYIIHHYYPTSRVEVSINWPAIGSVDPQVASKFAKDLQAASDLALECKSRLLQLGFNLV